MARNPATDGNARLGLIAGKGELPRRLLAACKASERPVSILALKGAADSVLLEEPHSRELRFGEAASGIEWLKAEGVVDIVMAGGVDRPSLSSLRPDAATAKLLARIGFRALGDDGLLSAIAKILEQKGFRVVGAHEILGGLLCPDGLIGHLAVPGDAEEDITRGIEVVRALGAVDVGRAAAIQQGLVLGVEAIEGTDALIRRAGALKRPGLGPVLVKLRKPGQDARLDLPTIGVGSIEEAYRAGFRGLVLEAGGVQLLDAEAVIRSADRYGLFVQGRLLS